MPRFSDQLLYIGGRYVPARGGHTFDVVNPPPAKCWPMYTTPAPTTWMRPSIAQRPANSNGQR